MEQSQAAPSFLRTWWIAVRPYAYTASVAPVVLGLGLVVASGGPVHWGLFALTALGLVCFHTGANLLNDCYDHRRGLDTEAIAMSGAIVRGLLSEQQVFRGAVLFLAVGTACGLILTWATGWVLLLVGVLGSIVAWGYTGPKWCFKYVGLGDAAIFAAFGPLPVFGTWWVQTQRFAWDPLLWSAPMACYIVAILHANNWRDIATDPQVNCRTMAQFWGPDGSAWYYRFLMLGPFAMVAALLAVSRAAGWLMPAPWTTLLAFGALPVAWKASRVHAGSDRSVFLALLGPTAQTQLVFGVLLSAGFFLGRVF